MNVKAQYDKNKYLFIGIMLLLGTCFITGSVFIFKWYMKRKLGHMKANGIQPSTEDFLAEVEGRENTVYLDEGKLAAGIGHDILPEDGTFKLGDTVSDDLIDIWFRKDVAKAAAEVQNHVTVPLNQNQFDALVSLNFNIGTGAFDGSTLKKYINGKKSQEAITNAWLAWNHSGGKENEGLKKRRQKEVDLYFS